MLQGGGNEGKKTHYIHDMRLSIEYVHYNIFTSLQKLSSHIQFFIICAMKECTSVCCQKQSERIHS